jgi:hypothetical protein
MKVNPINHIGAPMSRTNTKKPAKTPKEISTIKPLRSSTCPTLSGKATLTYGLGQDPSKGIHFKVTANDGGGFFSSEWVPWKDVEVAIHADEPVTSICLRSLFKGKSVNTSGFLLAVLVAEGILEALPKKTRLFEVTGKAPTATKAAKATKRKAPAKKA